MHYIYAVSALAGEAGQTAQGAGGAGPNPMNLVVMVGMMVILFYFIIARPQKREQQRQDQMRDSVKKGDRVVTIGGLHGTVAGVDTTNNTVSIQVDRNVKLDYSRSAIATVIRKEDAREIGATSDDSKGDKA